MNKDTYVKNYILRNLLNHYSAEELIDLIEDMYKPKLNSENVIKFLKEKNYEIYTDKPNIVGVRNNIQNYSQFDDWMFIIFLNDDESIKESYVFNWTTDPSTFYVKRNVTNDKGTARLKAGQYIDAYNLGLHRNSYFALVQRGKNPVTVERLDPNFNIVATETGYFGINIHKPTGRDELQEAVSYSSAGCQVSSKITDFNKFMQIIKQYSNLYYTYTLIELEQFNNILFNN